MKDDPSEDAPKTIGVADQIKQLYQQVASGALSWADAAKLEEEIHASIRPELSADAAEPSQKRSRRTQQVKWRAFACRLPYQLRGHFSDAQASALEALVFLSGKGGQAQVPIATIATLAQCSERSVQYMLRTAIGEGLLHRQEIRRAKHFNAPSVFTLLDSRLLYLADHMNNQFWERGEIRKQSELRLRKDNEYQPTEADLAALAEADAYDTESLSDRSPSLSDDGQVTPEYDQSATGAKDCALINKGFSIPTSGCKSRSSMDSRPKRPPATEPVFPPKSAENRHSGAHAPQNAWQSYQVRVSEAVRPRWAKPLGEAALGLIETSEGGLEALAQVVRADDDNNQVLDITDWHEGAEAIRRRKFPDISETYWESRVRIHGDRAYLAVLETWLKSETHSEHPIRSPDRYLVGILRRPPNECRPEVSLRKILTKHAKVQIAIDAVHGAGADRNPPPDPRA